MQCPKCFQIVPDGAVCPNCGASLIPDAAAAHPAPPTEPLAANYCAACGAALVAGARFCPSCGASVFPAPVAPAGVGASPTVSWLRELFASPLFMATAICYSVMTALFLFFSFVGLLPGLLDADGWDQLLMLAMLALFAAVPVCAVVGMWVQFAAARIPGSILSTGGLTAMGVSAVIGLLAEALMSFVFFGESRAVFETFGSSVELTLSLARAILTLFLIPVIIYRIKIASAAFGAAQAVRNGGELPPPSDYVETLAALWGVFWLLLILFVVLPIHSMADDLGLDQGGPVIVYLTMIAAGVSNLLLGALCSKARGLWRRHMAR